MWKSVDYIGSLENKSLPDGHKESYKKVNKLFKICRQHETKGNGGLKRTIS